MKAKLLACFIFLLFTSTNGAASRQVGSLIIKPKKITYTRIGSDVPEHRKTLEIRYPIITNKMPPRLKRRIENTVGYWRNFDTSLAKELADFGTYNIDYQINYNKNYLLDIALTFDGAGAYPTSWTKNLLVNLKTGEKLEVEDLFKKSALPKLLALIRKEMRAQEDKAVEENDTLKETLAQLRATKDGKRIYPPPENIKFKDLDGFTISARGVVFLYEYEFPHAIQAIEPEGRFFLSWTRLKSFIGRGGLLARFVR